MSTNEGLQKQGDEPVLEPDIEIIDAHHHLWRWSDPPYEISEYLNDVNSGHFVTKSVFVEAAPGEFRETGPDHLRPVGETEYIIDQARRTFEARENVLSGIVSFADLRSRDMLKKTLDEHRKVAGPLFKGIRQRAAHINHPEDQRLRVDAPAGLYMDADFQAGLRLLGREGLTFDGWHYFFQNQEFADSAKAAPGTTLILNHFGTPLGIGRFASRGKEVFDKWRQDIQALAACENVVIKLGGLSMPLTGFAWEDRAKPISSDEFAQVQRPYFLHAIECFGPSRCMVESNFPVDRVAVSYRVLFNGMKKILEEFSDDEKTEIFSGTATRIYRL